jgi:hypothetical protein
MISASKAKGDHIYALDSNAAFLSVWSSRYCLSPNSPSRRATYSVAFSRIFGSLSVGLYLFQRISGRSLLLFVGLSRYCRFNISSGVSNWKFYNAYVLLHRKFDDAECGYRLE